MKTIQIQLTALNSQSNRAVPFVNAKVRPGEYGKPSMTKLGAPQWPQSEVKKESVST
jgi:hypothetical protein